jgi:dipeptidyl aminopeptidase/acylaminoacyl peptidase
MNGWKSAAVNRLASLQPHSMSAWPTCETTLGRVLALNLIAFAVGCGGESAILADGSLIGDDANSEIVDGSGDGASTDARQVDGAMVDAMDAVAPCVERVAFSQATPGVGNLDIWIASLDGTGIQNVTDSPGSDKRTPVWSPDGQRLAFASNTTDKADIHIINVDGSGLRNLTNTPGESETLPAWSPDGQWILFRNSVTSNLNRLQAHRVSDGVLVTVAETRASDFSWSPDGARVVFHDFNNEWGRDGLCRRVGLVTIACPYRIVRFRAAMAPRVADPIQTLRGVWSD